MKNNSFKYLMICLLLWPIAMVAQIPDVFNSAFEKSLLQSASNGNAQANIQLFLAGALGDNALELQNAKHEFAEILAGLAADFPIRAKETRQVDFIYRGLRKAMFKHYTYIAEVAETFQHGSFNCVGSTALVALALDHFGFDYEIQRLPNHVFLYAKADEKWLRIESTSLDIGVVREKRISTAERNAVGRRGHSKMRPETIGLRDLAGWQYYNEGLKALDANANPAAFKAFYKASLLNQNAEISEMLVLANANLVFEAKQALAVLDYELAFSMLALTQQYVENSQEAQLCLAASILGKAEAISDLKSSLDFLQNMQNQFPKAMANPAVKAGLADRLLAMAQLTVKEDAAAARNYLASFSDVVNTGNCPYDLVLAKASFEAFIASEKANGQIENAKALALQFGKLKHKRIQLDENKQVFADQ